LEKDLLSLKVEWEFGKKHELFEGLGLSDCIAHPAYSSWCVVKEDDVRSFSLITRDPNFIHTDFDKTLEKSPFANTIAQGFYILSLLVNLTLSALPDFPGEKLWINYGIDNLRFTEPVPVGSKIRAKLELSEIKETKAGIRVLFAVEIQIEGHSKPALVAEWINLLI
jgi:acyl dehydratase